ncbi:MAG: hypothetical protein Q8N74_01805 [Sulfuricella sp.]|nr:hypothetical protein [Sulfuricella sp.]
MMPSSQKSSLEWFFNAPSAANFPQAIASPALSSLHSEFLKLVEACFFELPDVWEAEKDAWADLSKEALSFASQFRESFNSDTAFALIRILMSIGFLLKKLRTGTESKEQMPRTWRLFRSVLASLIVYAKESRDFTFKRDVLELVRQFEAS